MKKFASFIAIIILLGGCKKKVEEIQQDLVIKAMTNGQWVITNFTQNSNNITSAFTPYKFKYYSNKTVDAINNGTVEKTGSWDGNASNMTTWADFPNAIYPLTLINGTWHIDNNSWTYVLASQTVGAETKVMRLEKQ